MKRIGHRIFLLLSSVRVKSFVNTTGCLFVRQENESRVFCLSPTNWIVWIGAADEEPHPFKILCQNMVCTSCINEESQYLYAIETAGDNWGSCCFCNNTFLCNVEWCCGGIRIFYHQQAKNFSASLTTQKWHFGGRSFANYLLAFSFLQIHHFFCRFFKHSFTLNDIKKFFLSSDTDPADLILIKILRLKRHRRKNFPALFSSVQKQIKNIFWNVPSKIKSGKTFLIFGQEQIFLLKLLKSFFGSRRRSRSRIGQEDPARVVQPAVGVVVIRCSSVEKMQSFYVFAEKRAKKKIKRETKGLLWAINVEKPLAVNGTKQKMNQCDVLRSNAQDMVQRCALTKSGWFGWKL